MPTPRCCWASSASARIKVSYGPTCMHVCCIIHSMNTSHFPFDQGGGASANSAGTPASVGRAVTIIIIFVYLRRHINYRFRPGEEAVLAQRQRIAVHIHVHLPTRLIPQDRCTRRPRAAAAKSIVGAIRRPGRGNALLAENRAGRQSSGAEAGHRKFQVAASGPKVELSTCERSNMMTTTMMIWISSLSYEQITITGKESFDTCRYAPFFSFFPS
ncbi:hypothetical protein GGS23DRAFT_519747 [Durotheca rogersii]|uniref:uncharacterized protein n=1 Tax=Durotheca rogersii TaxID=419775 RepID=UPI00221F47E3|nr:uncharacterized protein GGS23DRAFT_519747 [Durotheca rogersii]KAI5863907.1 hypothetical protein GGS23DRAFT_519747 [Durotheca rogersii]